MKIIDKAAVIKRPKYRLSKPIGTKSEPTVYAIIAEREANVARTKR